MSTSSSRLAALVLILVALSSIGCAWAKASSERRRVIQDRTRTHIYDMSCDRIVPETRQLLFNRGYTVRNTGEGARTVETEWYLDPNTRDRTRYLIQLIDEQDEGCSLRANVNTENRNRNQNTTTTTPTNGRDLDFEWVILQEVDPESASRIMQEADTSANHAAGS